METAPVDGTRVLLSVICQGELSIEIGTCSKIIDGNQIWKSDFDVWLTVDAWMLLPKHFVPADFKDFAKGKAYVSNGDGGPYVYKVK